MAAGRKRQLNYELLRIIAMLMIVCLHYLSKGGLLGDPARAGMTADRKSTRLNSSHMA